MSSEEQGSDDEPDTAMHSGSDAGPAGERTSTGPLSPHADGGGDADATFPEESEAAARAAADDAPLPADGGPQGDGLEPDFRPPER